MVWCSLLSLISSRQPNNIHFNHVPVQISFLRLLVSPSEILILKNPLSKAKKLTIAISPAKKPRGLLHRKQDTSVKLVKPAMFRFDGVVKQLLKGVGENIFCQGIRMDAFLEIPLGARLCLST